MSRVQAFVDAARACVDTPFKHQGRQPGVGIDCAGVVVCAWRAAGLAAADRRGYSREPQQRVLRQALLEVCDKVDRPGAAYRPGDILFMRFGREPQHLAVVTDRGTIVHCWEAMGRCVEHGLDRTWRGRVIAVYRHRDLDDVG